MFSSNHTICKVFFLQNCFYLNETHSLNRSTFQTFVHDSDAQRSPLSTLREKLIFVYYSAAGLFKGFLVIHEAPSRTFKEAFGPRQRRNQAPSAHSDVCIDMLHVGMATSHSTIKTTSIPALSTLSQSSHKLVYRRMIPLSVVFVRLRPRRW